MKKRLSYIINGVILLTSLSCAKEVSQEDLVRAAVDIKIQQWRASQILTCKEKALLQAGNYVDSLLLVNSLQSKLDTIPKPGKPFKPPKPDFREKPDSVRVKPLPGKE